MKALVGVPIVAVPGLPIVSPEVAASGETVRPSTVGAFAPFAPRPTPKNGEHEGL